MVTVSLPFPADAGVMVGMRATADIMIDKSEDTLLVPERAVGLDDQGNPAVWVSADGQLEQRAVVIGISNGLQTEILAGLAEGEIVMTGQPGGFFPGS